MPSHPVDVHVGARIRQRRALLGMRQTSLGKAVDLTFQQIQKYERGSNRMGASRLSEFAKALDVPVSHFFEDMPGKTRSAGSLRRGESARGTPIKPAEPDPLIKRETLELVRAYYKIRVPGIRTKIAKLIKAVAFGHSLPVARLGPLRKKGG